MTYATFIYALAGVTLLGAIGFGVFSWFRAKRAQDQDTSTALEHAEPRKPR